MKICFVCFYAYPLFDPSWPGQFGGSEVRASLLARGLAERNEHKVTLVVLDHGQPSDSTHDGVRLVAHPHYKESTSLRASLQNAVRDRLAPAEIVDGIRFPRSSLQLYDRIAADVYCGFGVSGAIAEVAVACRKYGKPFVLMSGSDLDFSEHFAERSPNRNSYGTTGRQGRIAIDLASHWVLQTNDQRRLLSDRFGHDGQVIRNPVRLPAATSVPVASDQDRYVLWVGKADVVKQPQRCLELAIACPDIRFRMILDRSDNTLHRRVVENKPDNVSISDRVAYADIDDWFRQATALVNTSSAEGFPNTFLQAAVHDVPILSLNVDPDGFFSRHECGRFAHGSLDALADSLRSVWSEPLPTDEFARTAHRYLEKHHALPGRIEELDTLLKSVIGS